MIERALEVLKNVFGYDQFRAPQDAVVEQLCGGRDVLVVMPTGGGKSLCYQLPALLREGTAIVVSPLIALMQDQVAALSQWGIRAGCLNSAMDFYAQQETEHQLRSGGLDLLYIAPERLLLPRTLELLAECRLALFAIDEAHCVSQWGHDFRPEYLQLSRLCELFPTVPRIALTATADERTRAEIVERLGLGEAAVFVQGFDRPNIRYRIGQKDRGREQLLKFIQDEHPDDVGVVYCMSRKKVEETAAWLCEKGYNALPYHAGLSNEVRAYNQRRFLEEERIIMVATIAFGMGIDKPNVRFVAHMDLPRSVEAYYQETGRAGRDGLPADAWMVYGLQDVVWQRQMLESSQADWSHKQVERQKLEALLGLCEITTCRRQALLSYFGETSEPCNNCDTCLEPVPVWDGTDAARKALSAVYRSGQRWGVNHVVDTLVGKETDKVKSNGHERLSTFGIGKELEINQWRSVFRQLIARGLLRVDGDGHGVLQLTEECRPLLRGEATIELRRDLPKSRQRLKSSKTQQTRMDAEETRLWEALRACRKRLADAEQVPAYRVFGDATLMEMVMYRPLSHSQFHKLNGVGESKLNRYADEFIEVIRGFDAAEPEGNPQADASLTLFRSGMSVEQVGRQQKLSTGAIYNHLAQAIRLKQLEVDEVVELPSNERNHIEQVMLECAREHGAALKPVYEALAGSYDMGVLRCIKMGLE